MNTPICDFVENYIKDDHVRLHMPGHKGRDFLGFEKWDLTEIKDADELYHPEGIIAESEANAAALFGSRQTAYGTEGSSQCIRAMLHLAVSRLGGKGRILAARNVHKAFVYGAALLGLEVTWLYPEETDSLCRCVITAQQLSDALDACTEPVAGVFVTSPDYLGGIADIRVLAEVCHSYGTILMVDNAHGAYLHFLPEPMHPLDLGADLCCDSAHKTLPALTGTAYLHVSKTCPEIGDVKQAMELFGSTSPSYLLLQSLDKLNPYLAGNYRVELRKTVENLHFLREKLLQNGWHTDYSDPLRLTVNAAKSGWDGREFADHLRKYRIECEYADPDYVVLMATPQNPASDFERLLTALGINTRQPREGEKTFAVHPEQAISIRDAVLKPHKTVPLGDALGKICGAPTVSCPPAIPVVISGERIDEDCLSVLRRYGIAEIVIVQ